MRTRFIAVILLLVTAPVFGDVYKGQTMYVGGTAGFAEGTYGKLEMQNERALVFTHESAKLTIPYAAIKSFQYRQERARRLGVALTIAVGVLKRLQRRHFFNIDYVDEKGTAQTAIFEVAKDDAATVYAVLKTKAPCAQYAYARCKGSPPNASTGNAALRY
jgi:hypothetical protein